VYHSTLGVRVIKKKKSVEKAWVEKDLKGKKIKIR